MPFTDRCLWLHVRRANPFFSVLLAASLLTAMSGCGRRGSGGSLPAIDSGLPRGAGPEAGTGDSGAARADAGFDSGPSTPDVPTTPDVPMTATCGMSLGSAVGSPVYEGSTLGAADIVANSCSSGGAEALLTWTAPSSGEFVIDTSGSGLDTVLSVRRGGCDGEEVACNDDFGSETTSQVVLSALAGTVYIIVIEGYSGRTGSVVLNIQHGGAP